MEYNGYFHYDDSEAPLMRVRYPREASVEAIEKAFEFFVEQSLRHGRVGYVVDMRELNPVTASAKIRRAFADHFEAHRAVIEPATVAEAMIHNNRLTQGLVTAVNWLAPRQFPSRSFTDYAKGSEWMRSRLVAEGLMPPDRRFA